MMLKLFTYRPLSYKKLIFTFLILTCSNVAYCAQLSDELIATFLSCGQGDAIVIQTPSKNIHLIKPTSNYLIF